MSTCSKPQMRLYSAENERLYLNDEEFRRFVTAAHDAPVSERRFALTLAYTGMRISEARALRAGAVQLAARVISVHTLKRRGAYAMREIPIPSELALEFASMDLSDDKLLWSEHDRPVPRVKAYRWIKRLMAKADITGPKACPKGLRHAYGARASSARIPLQMLQKWMGHASIRTTAIYATIVGPEQVLLSDRMWAQHTPVCLCGASLALEADYSVFDLGESAY